MTTMSRQALFEAAWARPLTELAAEFGISDVGLRKICDRHEIPTPSRGYWAQVRAGKTFARPKLRPARDAQLEQVQIAGGRPLPAPVREAMRKAREGAPSAPRTKLQTRAASAHAQSLTTSTEASAAMATPAVEALQIDRDRPELQATVKALARARPDSSGFITVSGANSVPMKIGPDSQAQALEFLAALLAQADQRDWSLELGSDGAKLKVDGESLGFRLDETAEKTPHTPTPQELKRKAERDRWGGDSQPWSTWDLSPSGRLTFVIEEHRWSGAGLRRTFSQRKGFALVDSLDAVVAGLAGHAALKAERRREEEARAKAAAIAAARRERLQAFERREAQRTKFVTAVQTQLRERARLLEVLAFVEAQAPEKRNRLETMETWLRRRLRAIDARLDPDCLAVSARQAEVAFEEPPADAQRSYWYSRDVELYIWRPSEEEGFVRATDELDWAIAEGLIADPRDPPRNRPAEESSEASERSD